MVVSKLTADWGQWVSLAFVVACSSGVRAPEAQRLQAKLVSPTASSVYELDAPGIRVTIEAQPYRVHIEDASGTTHLETGSAPLEGYGGAQWADGSVEYSRIISAGYTSFLAQLDAWQVPQGRVHVRQGPSEITLTFHDSSDDAIAVARHAVSPSRLRVEVATVASPPPRAWSVGFRAAPNEGFMGFGERFNTTNQRGKRVWSWIEEGGVGTGEGKPEGPDNPMPSGEMMTYYAVPFFLSTHGYGFWLDTTYRSEFELGSEREDAWRAWHVGPTLAYEVYVPKQADTRPWPYHVIDQFTAATGRPMLPPAWAFGPRRRIGPGRKQQGHRELQAMRDLDIAVTAVDDAVHFFPSGGHHERQVELKEWIQHARALGYRVNGYYNSFVDKAATGPMATFAEQGKAKGYFVRLEDGSYPFLKVLTGRRMPSLYLIDFTQPGAAEWYGKSFDWALDLGYSGWMYDFGEYLPAEALGADGRTGEELHNLYPTLYAKALHSALSKHPSAKEWFAFQRSGYTGTSHYVPFIWSGDPAASFEDSDGLPSMVPAGVNLGISGAPHFGGDIGGFHCVVDGAEAANAELVTRWVQLGAMTSNMMDQNACVGGLSKRKASIWNSPEVRKAWQVYGRLHTRLFPYLYTLAHEASRTGAPTMRQPFLEYPTYPALASVDDAYFFGPALYVMPVLARGEREVTRLVPPGEYLDWNTQRMIAGPSDRVREVTFPAPLDTLPLLLRENHILPMLDASIDTLAEEQSQLIIGRQDVSDVYDLIAVLGPAGRASSTLWDGCQFSVRRVSEVSPPQKSYAAVTSAADLQECAECYRLDQLESGLTRLRVTTRAPTLTVGGVHVQSSCPRRVRWDLYLNDSSSASLAGPALPATQ